MGGGGRERKHLPGDSAVQINIKCISVLCLIIVCVWGREGL